jgi:hypothetical protein
VFLDTSYDLQVLFQRFDYFEFFLWIAVTALSFLGELQEEVLNTPSVDYIASF